MKDHPAWGIISSTYDTNMNLKKLSEKLLSMMREHYKDTEQITISDTTGDDEIRLAIGSLHIFVRTLYGFNCMYTEFGLFAVEYDKIFRHVMQEIVTDDLGNLLTNGRNVNREFHLLGLTIIKNMIAKIEKDKNIRMPLSKNDIEKMNQKYTEKSVIDM